MSIKSLYPDTRPSLNLDFANTKVLDPRITFARASTATYYDGKTVSKAEENLITESQTLNGSSWQSLGMTTISGGQTAPDGTSTAFAFTENTVNETHRTFKNFGWVSGRTYTISFFAKYASRQYIQLNVSTFSNSRVIFDIQNGTVTDPSGAVSTSVVNYGNGWYRFSATILGLYTFTGSFPIGGNSTSTGNGEIYTGNGLLAYYLWGVQVEERSGASAYTPTTSQPITKYQPTLLTAPINTPRFDHNPTTSESLGLLIEEQRTNLISHSSNFADSVWNKNYTAGYSSTVESNAAVAPDGTLTASRIYRTLGQGSGSIGIIRFDNSGASGQSYSTSVYLKYSGYSTNSRYVILVSSDASSGNHETQFDILTGTIVSNGSVNTSSITNVGNGWYRCTVSASTQGNFRYVWIKSDLSLNEGSGFLIWGAQFESGLFPTSYIPTVASQATRSADSASMTGTNFTSWYRTDEGTFYADVARISLAPGSIQSVFGTNVNYSDLALGSGGANFRFGTGPGIDLNLSSAATIAKYAASYESNTSHYLSVNGDTTGTRTQTTALPNSTALFLGKGDGTSSTFPFNGWFKKFSYYPKRLTNTQLQALTQP